MKKYVIVSQTYNLILETALKCGLSNWIQCLAKCPMNCLKGNYTLSCGEKEWFTVKVQFEAGALIM